jgi:UDP-N-acetylmuramate dehydrogenase
MKDLREHEPLAPRTTLQLGGPARFFVTAHDDASVIEALRFAQTQTLPVAILGGGSNLVVSDAGHPGLVIAMAQRGVSFVDQGDHAELTAAAGEPWDDLVAATVERGLAGLECLSGIPGLAGATPIQNVGAYGQEVAQTVSAVRVLDRQSLTERTLSPAECGFSYRDSALKRDPERYVVLSVTFSLVRGGAPALRYAELQRALGARSAAPTLAEVRQTVLELRRSKSMVLDPSDENRRSVGSFFMNPVISQRAFAALREQALHEGLVSSETELPAYPAPDGVKLAAAWLIERAGFTKGERRGAVGISSRHALALVHHGGGSSRELLALAGEIRDRVRARFGVTLVPEPVLLGVS